MWHHNSWFGFVTSQFVTRRLCYSKIIDQLFLTCFSHRWKIKCEKWWSSDLMCYVFTCFSTWSSLIGQINELDWKRDLVYCREFRLVLNVRRQPTTRKSQLISRWAKKLMHIFALFLHPRKFSFVTGKAFSQIPFRLLEAGVFKGSVLLSTLRYPRFTST